MKLIKNEKYGNITFISFYGVVLTRLTYLDDAEFVEKYCSIFGPIISEKIMQCIDVAHLEDIFNDEKIFHLNDSSHSIPTFTRKGKKYIAFSDGENNMAKRINIVNDEEKGKKARLHAKCANHFVSYISIATSNYGEVYVIADKRIPHTIWVTFRGAYSPKTLSNFLNFDSLFPFNVNKEGYIYSLLKILMEIIHTLLESIRYLCVHHLKSVNPNSVKIMTTGHSIGGALSTIFSYYWIKIRDTHPYNSSDYNFLQKQIGCFTVASLRCMNQYVSEQFCKYIKQKKIAFSRLATKGDIVTAIPFKESGFHHPCSDNSKDFVHNCQSTTDSNYETSLDCIKEENTYDNVNVYAHGNYLNILYRITLVKHFTVSNMFFTTAEIYKKNGNPVCRIILYDNNIHKAVFFDMTKIRASASFTTNGLASFFISKETHPCDGEDVFITKKQFDELINKAFPIRGKSKSPKRSSYIITDFSRDNTKNPVCRTMKQRNNTKTKTEKKRKLK